MAVTKEITKIEHSAVRVAVTLKNEDVKTEYNKHVKNLLKNIQLPGFRRGRVPTEVLERKAGAALLEDILGQIVSNTLKTIFEADDYPQDLLPVPFADPQLEGNPKLDLESDFVFSVVFDVMPNATIDRWEGFEVTVDEAEISEADIARELENIRERNAIVIDREAGEASQKSDIVTVNYSELDENGQLIADSAREAFIFELGTGRNLFQFDEEITGMKVDEERKFSKTYPKDFANIDLAGSTKTLLVKMTKIKRKELPALDDDLAQDIDEKYKTLDDLKKDIRKKLQLNIEEKWESMRNDAILNKILESITLELPESLIRYGIQNHLRRISHSPEILENEAIQNMARPDVETQTKKQFVVSKLISLNQIEVTDADMEKEYEECAQQSGEKLDQVKGYFQADTQMLEDLKLKIKIKKLFALLASKNTIKKGKKVTYLDLFPENA